MGEFLALVQGCGTVAQYKDKFLELARFATELVKDEKMKVMLFEQGLGPIL